MLGLSCTTQDLFKFQHVESSSLTRDGNCTLHWEHGVLATGPLGKSLGCFYLTVQFYVFLFWYILDTSHLSDMCFASICSQSVACIFHSLNWPLQNRTFDFYCSPLINWIVHLVLCLRSHCQTQGYLDFLCYLLVFFSILRLDH